MKTRIEIDGAGLGEALAVGEWPALLWEPDLNVFVLATRAGVGMVLSAGNSRSVKAGQIIPYAASRWQDEPMDFVNAPVGAFVKIASENERESQ